MKFTIGRDHRGAAVFRLEEAVYRLAHRNQKCAFVKETHDPSFLTLRTTTFCLQVGNSSCCSRETAGGVSDENNILAFLFDELAQKFIDNLNILSRLRVAVLWRVSIIVWIRDVADVQFTKVRCRKLWAVSFDSLPFQCSKERLEGLGRVVGAVANDYRKGWLH